MRPCISTQECLRVNCPDCAHPALRNRTNLQSGYNALCSAIAALRETAEAGRFVPALEAVRASLGPVAFQPNDTTNPASNSAKVNGGEK